ncbi:FAD-dependent oxidoreductase [Phototrophicus methaneseepsis]|uniref:FAD-dependent oxidoreductase n=1 Tax=Phototrophicus methaneseepsis TaxID=2710758 RepID=A0A7S8ICX4_9CHLR|nr:FAD-dependent oxidoreductase [Phototrophicus methaneseepsis]QPC80941.1 FAD-dependent oxidoreductase [Phototrophicus methaneseepsis]
MSTNKKGISRRSFIKNTSMGLAASAGAGMLSAPQIAAAQESTNGLSWETAPEPIPDSEIVETIDADVVVVGAGLAGTTAACRAAENGGSVVVIEKGAMWSGRGGGIGVFTSKMMREQGIELDKESIAREWVEMCGNRAKEPLIWKFLDESGNAMDWWIEKAEAIGITGIIWGGYYKGPTYTENPAYHMFFGGPASQAGRDPGAELANLMYDESLKLGVTYHFRAPGEQLIKDGDRVVGVIASTEEGYKRFNASKGVIMATGDIGGNADMCAAYAPLALKVNHSDYTPIGQNTGDGHRMGLWAGGVFQDTPFPTMIHPQAFSWLQYAYLFVNQRGQRYMNEDSWVQAKSLQLMMQPDVPWGFSIFDANWPEEVAQTVEIGGGMFWDSFRPYGVEWTPDGDRATMQSYIEGGEIGFTADTLEELAEKIGVPVDTFVATVERYNELVENGKDTDFGKRAELLYPISEAPFYALKFGPALLTVVGGLDIDTNMRVLNAEGNPVPGLYAVGNCSGSLYGEDYPIQIPGNSHGRALTWGYLAGKNIMDEA